MENLLESTWYTADSKKPYLVKAGATIRNGYSILITDLENTYFCAGDQQTIIQEKKVFKYLISQVQKFNPTIETEDYGQLISLINDAFSKHDSNTSYHLNKVSRDQIYFKLQKQMEIYPFKWEFYCIQIPHEDHISILREFLVAPLISTINVLFLNKFKLLFQSLENKYEILLKRHQTLEQQYKDKLLHEKEKMKFQTFENDHQIWNKSISVDETMYQDFPQLKNEKSIVHIFNSLQNSRFKNLYGEKKKRDYDELYESSDDLKLDDLLQEKNLRDSKQKMKKLKLNDDEGIVKQKPQVKDKKSIKPLIQDLDEDNETDPEERHRRLEIEKKLQKKQLQQEDSQIPQLSQGGDAKKKKPKKPLKFV